MTAKRNGWTGEKVVRLRRRLHVTQEQLARMLNVSVVTVNRWEKRKTSISPLAAQALERLA